MTIGFKIIQNLKYDTIIEESNIFVSGDVNSEICIFLIGGLYKGIQIYFTLLQDTQNKKKYKLTKQNKKDFLKTKLLIGGKQF